MSRTFYIVGNYLSYAAMFVGKGWEEVDLLEQADLVVFCGGEDVCPELYGQAQHPTTYCNPKRDAVEVETWQRAKELGIPCVGICRGGQFLHVMNGGKLFQDVDGHAISGTHEATILGNLVPVQVTSTHHQMMEVDYSNEHCLVLMTASLSTRRISMESYDNHPVEHTAYGKWDDVEAVYWSNNNDLCFQPHPEYGNVEECRNVFFSFIETYLF